MKTEKKSHLGWFQSLSLSLSVFSLSSFLADPSNKDHAAVERGGIREMGIFLFFVPTPIKYGQC